MRSKQDWELEVELRVKAPHGLRRRLVRFAGAETHSTQAKKRVVGWGRVTQNPTILKIDCGDVGFHIRSTQPTDLSNSIFKLVQNVSREKRKPIDPQGSIGFEIIM
jgi:hypothetical protein